MPTDPDKQALEELVEREERGPEDWVADGDCSNCDGEGVVYGCSWDWQCDTWDGDSCLCERPCEWCQTSLRAHAKQETTDAG